MTEPPTDLTTLTDQAISDLLPIVHESHLGPLLAELDRRDAEQARRLNHPDALGKAALWYAEKGIAVFPLRPRGKLPLLRSAHPDGDPARGVCHGECGRQGHGLHDATTDLDTIRAWWASSPRANIGVPTGHLFDVIDVDGPVGHLSLASLYEERAIPDTLGRVYTGGGGLHLLIPPTGEGNAAGLRDGIDYRGAGGYIVAPPSIHDSGRRYVWLDPPEVAA